MLILNKNPAGDFGQKQRVPRLCKILWRSGGVGGWSYWLLCISQLELRLSWAVTIYLNCSILVNKAINKSHILYLCFERFSLPRSVKVYPNSEFCTSKTISKIVQKSLIYIILNWMVSKQWIWLGESDTVIEKVIPQNRWMENKYVRKMTNSKWMKKWLAMCSMIIMFLVLCFIFFGYDICIHFMHCHIIWLIWVLSVIYFWRK